jgi:hypothetical protein
MKIIQITLLILSFLCALPKLDFQGNFNIIFDIDIPKELPNNLVHSLQEGTVVYENKDNTKLKNIVLNPNMFKSLSMNGNGLITFKKPADFDSISLKSDYKLILNGPWFTKDITFDGDGLIQSKKVQFQKINITLKGKIDVVLQGYLNVGEINAHDLSQIDLYWVDSNVLKINTYDNALVKVAGKCNVLNLQLKDKSRIISESLRAKEIYSKSSDSSIVKILALKDLYVLASDFSEVWQINKNSNNFIKLEDNAVYINP